MANKRTSGGVPTAGSNPSGGGGGGSATVDQIVAGTNITVTPGGGTGVVTVNAVIPPAAVGSVVSGDAGISVTNVGGVVTVGQIVAAEWTRTNPRIYAVDGVNGNDANAGFADCAGTSAGQYAAACAAAGLVAKRTIAGLAAIFPRVGNGRFAVILIASGTYTDDLATVLTGVVGYASGYPLIRGTVTDTTAGSVAFAGTAADSVMSGGVTATGMNVAGYNPTGAPTTSTVQCLKVGGAAPAFAAEPAIPLGWRIRFDAVTTTAGLRNVCRQVCQVVGTDTLLLQSALAATPVAADIFYIEMGGVILPAMNIAAPASSQLGIQLSGIRFSGLLNSQFVSLRIAFCGCASLSTASLTVTTLIISQFFSDPILSTITPGGGLRSEADFTQAGGYSSLNGLVTVTGVQFNNCQQIVWGAGCAARNLKVFNSRLMQGDTSGSTDNFGTSAAVGIPHTFGTSGAAFVIEGSDLKLNKMNLIGAGATPAIQVKGKCSIVFAGIVSGLTGNTDVGLDLQNAILTVIEFRASLLPTVAGTAGEIRMSSQALAAYSNTTFEELWDQGANRIFQGNTNSAAYRATMSPSVYAGVVNNGALMAGYALACIQAASGQVRYAQADTLPHAIGLVGALLAGANNGAQCLYVGSGYKVVLFDGGAVTPGAVAYLSDATPGAATCTVPVVSGVKAKLRIGVVVDNTLPFGLGIIRMTPDNYPVLADGLP